jgi:hypothetical protein
MRLFEFSQDESLEKLVIILRNFVGRASSKNAAVKLNWSGLNNILQKNNASIVADYETFKAMYDSSPVLQSIVKNFNADGIELNVPGAPDEEPQGDGTAEPGDSQAAVDKIAASAAPANLG